MQFDESMNEVEKKAWKIFKCIVADFLGTTADLLEGYRALDELMSIKLHFLHSHLDYFPGNCCQLSEEQEERFHLDIKVIEE